MTDQRGELLCLAVFVAVIFYAIGYMNGRLHEIDYVDDDTPEPKEEPHV